MKSILGPEVESGSGDYEPEGGFQHGLMSDGAAALAWALRKVAADLSAAAPEMLQERLEQALGESCTLDALVALTRQLAWGSVGLQVSAQVFRVPVASLGDVQSRLVLGQAAVTALASPRGRVSRAVAMGANNGPLVYDPDPALVSHLVGLSAHHDLRWVANSRDIALITAAPMQIQEERRQ